MPLICVAHDHSNNKFLFRGVIGYPWFPFWNCKTSLGTVEKLWMLNNIASIVLVAIKYLLELSLQNGVRPCAQITGSWGTCSHPPKNSAQMRINGKNHTKIEKVMTRTSKLAFIQDFFQRELAAAKPKGCQQISIPASQLQPFRLRSSYVITYLRKVPSVNPLLHASLCNFCWILDVAGRQNTVS